MARAGSRCQGSAVAVAVAVLGLLSCCSLPLAHAQLSDKKVYNDKDFYNAFIDDSVGAIGLSYDGASLAPYAQALYKYVNSNGGQPYVLRRSLTIYGNVQGARPSFDFAYLGAIVQLPPGTTFTLRGLTLRRMQALRAPVGIFATSPNANVVIRNCINVQQVCWPHEAAQVYFLQVFQRPFEGTNQATICAPGTEGTCNQYTFTDVGLFVNPSPEFGSGGYTMHYLNSYIQCQSYPNPVPSCPTLQSDLATNPYNCLATVYDPANSRTVCPTCSCINSCRTTCNAMGMGQQGRC